MLLWIMWVYVPVHTVAYVHMYMEARGGYWMSFLDHAPPYIFYFISV